MRVKRWLAAAATTVMAAAFAVSGTAPASAVELSSGCTDLNNDAYDGYFQVVNRARVFNAGEQISFTGEAGELTLTVFGLDLDHAVDSGTGPDTVTYLFTEDTSDPVFFSWRTSDVGTDWIVSCSYVGLPASHDRTGGPPIPAWVQAYARDGKDATCQEGWGLSWQKWAEDVSGGWVCTRTVPSLG